MLTLFNRILQNYTNNAMLLQMSMCLDLSSWMGVVGGLLYPRQYRQEPISIKWFAIEMIKKAIHEETRTNNRHSVSIERLCLADVTSKLFFRLSISAVDHCESNFARKLHTRSLQVRCQQPSGNLLSICVKKRESLKFLSGETVDDQFAC